MNKNFDDWNNLKKKINSATDTVFYNEREVWWCSLGLNIGFEQDGSNDEYRRPVLILKGLSPRVCMVIPLTTSTRKHHLRLWIGKVGEKTATALLSQIRAVDTCRLVRKIERIDRSRFEAIRKAVKDML